MWRKRVIVVAVVAATVLAVGGAGSGDD